MSVTVAAVLSSVSLGSEYREELLEIVSAFENSDPEVQYSARRRLEILVSESTVPDQPRGAAKITDDLLHALDQRGASSEAKKYLIRQLARVGTSKAVAPLFEIMFGDDTRLAEDARAAIESISGSRANNALKKAYAKVDTDGQIALLKSLARRKEASSVGFIARELHNESESVAVVAAWALGEIGNAGSLGALRKALDKTRSDAVKRAIERSMVSNLMISSNELHKLFQDSSNGAIRRASLRELIDRQAGSAAESISKGLTSEDGNLRMIAIESALSSNVDAYQRMVLDRVPAMEPGDLAIVLGALENVGSETAETIALQVYENGEENLQLAALEVIGEVGSGRSIDLLLRVFGSGKRSYQIKAASALAQLEAVELDNRLKRMLKSASRKEVLLAQEILVYRNIPDGKKYLLEFVKSEDAALARGALKTLSVIADESDLDALYELAQSGSGESTQLVVSLLKKLAPEFGSESLRARVANL